MRVQDIISPPFVEEKRIIEDPCIETFSTTGDFTIWVLTNTTRRRIVLLQEKEGVEIVYENTPQISQDVLEQMIESHRRFLDFGRELLPSQYEDLESSSPHTQIKVI